LGPNKGQNKEKFDKSSIWNALIFGMEHPRGKEIQVVQMKSLGLCMDPRQGVKLLHSDTVVYTAHAD